MALTRQQKSAQLADLTKKIEQAKSVIFTRYIGLKVSEISTLRSKLKQERAEMKVSKKTLIRLATKQAQAPEPTEEQLSGDIACIFSMDEPAAGARIAYTFGKDHSSVQLTGGIFEGKLLTKAETLAFATLPSRQILLGIFAMMIRSPLTKFAFAISSPLSSFARAVSEVAKKKASPPVAA